MSLQTPGKPSIICGTIVNCTLSTDRSRTEHRGIVRYVGKAGQNDWWIGVELNQSKGKHDGRARNNTKYFSCPNKHGIYLRPWHVLPSRDDHMSLPSSKLSKPLLANKQEQKQQEQQQQQQKRKNKKLSVPLLISYIQTVTNNQDLIKLQETCVNRMIELEHQQTVAEQRVLLTRVYSTRQKDVVVSGDINNKNNTTTTTNNNNNKKHRVDLVVNEIHETEKSYVSDITTIIDVYLIPLVKYNIITSEESNLLFSNIETLRDLNESMLRDLQSSCTTHSIDQHSVKDNSEETVGECLGRYGNFFKLYNDYISNYHQNVHNVLNILENRNRGGSSSEGSSGNSNETNDSLKPMALFEKDDNDDDKILSTLNFRDFCSHVMTNDKRCRNLNLKSFLIMPIQRIPRYVLLLKELIKQINKVLNNKQNNDANNNNKKPGKKKNNKKTKNNNNSNKNSSEDLFHKSLQSEIKSIEKALLIFQSVARQIDSKITQQEETNTFIHLVEHLDWSRTRYKKNEILTNTTNRKLIQINYQEYVTMKRTTSKKNTTKSTMFWLFTDMLCYGNKTMLGRYAVHKIIMFQQDHIEVIKKEAHEKKNNETNASPSAAFSDIATLTIQSDVKTFDIIFTSNDDLNLWYNLIVNAMKESNTKESNSNTKETKEATLIQASTTAIPVAPSSVSSPPLLPPRRVKPTNIQTTAPQIPARRHSKTNGYNNGRALSPSVRRAQKTYGGSGGSGGRRRSTFGSKNKGSGNRGKGSKSNTPTGKSKLKSKMSKMKMTGSTQIPFDSYRSPSTSISSSSTEKSSNGTPSPPMNHNIGKITSGSPVQRRNHTLLASSNTKMKAGTKIGTKTKTKTKTKKKRSTKASSDSLMAYYERMNMAKSQKTKGVYRR